VNAQLYKRHLVCPPTSSESSWRGEKQGEAEATGNQKGSGINQRPQATLGSLPQPEVAVIWQSFSPRGWLLHLERAVCSAVKHSLLDAYADGDNSHVRPVFTLRH
jgi:hypothetical protein